MNGSIVALDGTTLDFVTPAIGHAELYKNFREDSGLVVEDHGMSYTSFSGWYREIKPFAERVAFIGRRGEDKFIGYLTCTVFGEVLTCNVSIIPACRGNGYARAAIVFACEWADKLQYPCKKLMLGAKTNETKARQLVLSFGDGTVNEELGMVFVAASIQTILHPDK